MWSTKYVEADQLRVVTIHHTLTRHFRQARKGSEMVNESMSLEELTGRAYARGLPAGKVSPA